MVPTADSRLMVLADSHKIPEKSVSRRPACADRVARENMEPRAHFMNNASSYLPRFRAVFALFTTMHVSPWHAESETVLGFHWGAVLNPQRHPIQASFSMKLLVV